MNSALANLAMFNVVAAFAMALTLAVMSRSLGESSVRGVYNAIVACLAVAIACFLVTSSGGLE